MELKTYKKILDTLSVQNPDYETAASSTVTIEEDANDLTFNIINKNIKLPANLKDILVQGDKKSRVVHFIMNRFFDGTDLSAKTFYIKFVNAKKESGFNEISAFQFNDKQISFDWVVDSNVTVLDGEVSVQLEIISENTAGNTIYRYQTTKIALMVEKTIEVGSDAQEPDYYLDLKFLNDYPENTDYIMASSTPAIQLENRTLQIPELEDIAVTNDSRSKVITFEMERYFDGADRYDKTIVIKYKLSNGSGDRCFIGNKSCSDTKIRFDWILDGKVTSAPGKVTFAIEFLGYNEKNEFYCFNTLASYINILQGLDVDDSMEHPSPSWLQSWVIQADSYLDQYFKYITIMGDKIANIIQYIADCKKYAQNAKDSELAALAYKLSAANSQTIAFTEAERAKFYSEEARNSKNTSQQIKSQIQTDLDTFHADMNNFMLKSDKIKKDDLNINLINELDAKAKLEQVRLKSAPIEESDLSYALALKINNGSGGSGGIIVSGAQIDDSEASYSKTYSSNHIENRIETEIRKVTASSSEQNGMTSTERKKLASVEYGATNYKHPLYHTPEMIQESDEKQFISWQEKELFQDKYTKDETDAIISGLSTGVIWKQSVPTFADILLQYPNPENNWTVQTDKEGSFMFDGTSWIQFGSGTAPNASMSGNGYMTSQMYQKLYNIQENANCYVHPASHSADMIAETNNRKFLTPQDKARIDQMDTAISDAIAPYRKKADPIGLSDLDSTLSQTIQSAAGKVINDDAVSLASSYSSAKIASLFAHIAEESALNNLVNKHFN